MTAPRLARWLIRLAAPAGQAHELVGDLEEVHRRRAAGGPAAAWCATVADAFVIAVVASIERLRTRPRAATWVHVGDLRLGLRIMRREPIVTVTGTAALALGMGLLTVAVATVDTLLFSRLPFEGGDRFVLVSVLHEVERRPVRLTPDAYALIAARTTALEHLGAASQNLQNLTLPSGVVADAVAAGITPSSLRFLPYRPVRGRLLTSADAAPGAAPVVMIRDAFWQRAFGGADEALGATIEIGGIPRIIVGIMPDDFKFPSRPPDFWTPIGEGFLEGRGELPVNARLFGILAPGHSIESAQSQLAALSAQVTPVSEPGQPARLAAASVTDLGPQAPVMASAILLVAIAILAVVAANVANLVLARSYGRSRELAVRTALGASRARLIGQITVEVLVLCSVAAVLGALGGQAVLRQFNAMDDLPFWVDFTAGPRTLVLVIGGVLLATTIAGAWPAFRVTRRNLAGVLQSGGGYGEGVRFGRVAGASVVTQIAVSVVMLHGALVVADGVAKYAGRSLDLPANVLTTGLRFNTGVTAGGSLESPDFEQIERIASALPGVVAAGLTTALPRHSPPAAQVEVEPLPGEPARAPQPAPWAEVSPGYFGALGAHAVSGRLFADRDTRPNVHPVAIVNVPFVRTFLEGAYPVGRRFRTIDADGPGAWREIVGVVPDLGLSVGDPSLAAGYYVPFDPGAGAPRFIYLAARVTGDPLAHVAPLRQAVYQHDPTIVLTWPQPLEDVNGEDRAFFLWFSTALTGLGIVTLILALTGVYAMMALIVTRRTREIGIRIALGATSRRVAGTIVGRAAWQVALGGLAGGVLAVLSLDLRGVLVSRLPDGGPWTLPLVICLLVLAGLAATSFPLRRALRVRPSDAMRVE